jgi:hypothetical protein
VPHEGDEDEDDDDDEDDWGRLRGPVGAIPDLEPAV